MFNPSKVKLVMFDLFGTVIDMEKAKLEDLKAYGDHIKKPWAPLTLPEEWLELPPYSKGFDFLDWNIKSKIPIVTLSNAPTSFQIKYLTKWDLPFNSITPLELFQRFKPDLYVYQMAAKLYGVPHENCLMVSGNEHFGDIEAAQKLGMQSCLINRHGNGMSVEYFNELAHDWIQY